MFTLVADATLFTSLLFGTFYLCISAPNWPPATAPEPNLLLVLASFVALAVAALAAAVALHAGISLLFLLSNLMRLAAGFISPQRLLDLRLTRLWLDYTALTGAIALALVLVLPALAAILGTRP
jgi:cytochrome c oxidase subunit I+III